MAVLNFTRQQVQELLEFCQKHQVEDFFFAKDQGVYIGASVGSHKDGNLINCIKYAEGCDPSQDEDVYGDWYENARDLCGGDDVGVHADISVLEGTMKIDSWTNFLVSVSPTQITFKIE